MLALLAWPLVGALPPAYADCAGTPTPSPYVFTGVVTGTRAQDRVARVRTDAGRDVTVLGSPSRWSGVSSVDRTYRVGTR